MSVHPLPGRACFHAREEDLVWSGDRQVSEKVRRYLVCGMLFAGLGLLVDRDQPHQLHQPPHPVSPTFVAFSLHVTGHLP